MKAFRIEKARELETQKKDIKPNIEETGDKISKVVGEKIFRIEKLREIDAKRKEINVDIKDIGEKLEDEIGKIEELKKMEDFIAIKVEAKSNIQKWLDQLKKFRKSV